MALKQSSALARTSLLLGTLALVDCGGRSGLNKGQPEANTCTNEQPEAGLCCKDNVQPEIQPMIDNTHTSHTSAELCKLVAAHTEAVLCFFDRKWSTFLFPWAMNSVDQYGDQTLVSDAFGAEGLPGEMICSYSSYQDGKGTKRENTDCDYNIPETGLEFFFSGSQPRVYPEYTEVYGFLKIPARNEFIDFAFFIDGKPEPGADYEANVPNVWLRGTEINNLQYGACGDEYKDKIAKFSSQIAAIARRVVNTPH